MFVVDTNILLYAAITDFDEHPQARRALESWRRGDETWFLTWPIIYEFLRVATHRAVFDRPLKFSEAWSFLTVLMDSPGFALLTETAAHGEIIAELLAEHPRLAGNVFHDLHTVALMNEHGVREIRTADSDFHQFKSLRVVNPISG